MNKKLDGTEQRAYFRKKNEPILISDELLTEAGINPNEDIHIILEHEAIMAEAGILRLFYVNWPHCAMVWNTHLSIPKTMVFLKSESVYTLSEILQVVPQRYAVAESNFCEAKALNGSTGKIFPLRQSNKATLTQIVRGPQESRIYYREHITNYFCRIRRIKSKNRFIFCGKG